MFQRVMIAAARTLVFSLAIGTCLTRPAAAQTPPSSAGSTSPTASFAALAKVLNTGDTVSVTNGAGKKVKGKVQHVSGTTLTVRSDQLDLSFDAPDVQRVARSRHTVRNGALIGLVGGFGLGAISAASDPFFSEAAGVLMFGGFCGAIGAGIGAGVGAGLRREDVLFQRQATGAKTMITPLLSPSGGGLRVQIRW